MSIVFADLGGTHLRLAKVGSSDTPIRYKIAEYPDIDSILREFSPDVEALYLAAAIQPRNGLIEDKRFGDKSHWSIDLALLRASFDLKELSVFNDLEAAAYALPALSGNDIVPLVPASQNQTHFEDPPKILIGVGTGIGHAFLFEKEGCAPFVQRTHGGHIPAIAVTDEQKHILSKMAAPTSRELVVEDIVSGTGYKSLCGIVDEQRAMRLFWEFLGLYCNMLVGGSGAYGGVYLTGGVMDEFFEKKLIDAESLSSQFHRPMAPVVVESLAATPVYYCREQYMAIRGLERLVAMR